MSDVTLLLRRLSRSKSIRRVRTPGAARLLVLMITFVACRDAASPEPPPRAVVLDAAQIEAVVGQTDVQPNARVPNVPTAIITLQIATESRWLSEDPVLDTAALRSGRIVPIAAGRVVVTFSSDGAASAQLTLNATLREPTVLHVRDIAAVKEGDTVHLRGFRMSQAPKEVVLAGTVTALLVEDSANARFVVPDLSAAPPDAECASAVALPFELPGVALAPHAKLSRVAPRISLPSGIWRRVSMQEASCLRLEPTSSRHILAWVDPTSVVDSGVLAPAGFDRVPGVHTLTVAERSAAPRFGSFVRPLSGYEDQMSETKFVTPEVASNTATLIDRTTYVVGDTFTVFPDQLGATQPLLARVYAVYGRVPVLGPADDGAAAVFAERILPQMDRVGPVIDTVLIPLLRRTTVDRFIGTTSGHLPILFRTAVASSGSSSSTVSSLAMTDHVELTALVGSSFSSITGTALQLRMLAAPIISRYIDEVHGFPRELPRPVTSQRLQEWSWVSLREFIATETGRLALGIGWESNYDFGAESFRPFFNFPLEELIGGGQLSRGLSNGGSGYVRSLVAELMTRHGQSYESAVRLMVESAPFGLFGCYQLGCRPSGGLVAAMRRFDPSFEPVGSLLRFTLSQAADDLSTAAEFQNRHFASAGRLWLTGMQITSGSGSRQVIDGMPMGYSGYIVIHDNGLGGVYSIASNAPLQLALLRLPD